MSSIAPLIAAFLLAKIRIPDASATYTFFQPWSDTFNRNPNRIISRQIVPSNAPLPQFTARPSPQPTPSPHISKPSSTDISIDGPSFTGGPYRLSANVIRFPTYATTAISHARAENKSMHIFAVHATFAGHMDLRGIPELRVFAHTCVFESPTSFEMSAGPRNSFHLRKEELTCLPILPLLE